MEKRLSCRDVGVDCDFVACGKSEEEIFQKAAEHARTDHNMSEIPQELRDKARLAIRNVEHC
jgi:predicted small metal-binding protein